MYWGKGLAVKRNRMGVIPPRIRQGEEIAVRLKVESLFAVRLKAENLLAARLNKVISLFADKGLSRHSETYGLNLTMRTEVTIVVELEPPQRKPKPRLPWRWPAGRLQV